MSSARALNRAAVATLVILIFFLLAWELWLAPLRPGGSWLVLKALPLFAPLPGLLRGRRYTHQWTTMLALLYVCEGLVRATSDPGLSAVLAAIETGLASTLFLSCAFHARVTRSVN